MLRAPCRCGCLGSMPPRKLRTGSPLARAARDGMMPGGAAVFDSDRSIVGVTRRGHERTGPLRSRSHVRRTWRNAQHVRARYSDDRRRCRGSKTGPVGSDCFALVVVLGIKTRARHSQSYQACGLHRRRDAPSRHLRRGLRHTLVDDAGRFLRRHPSGPRRLRITSRRSALSHPSVFRRK